MVEKRYGLRYRKKGKFVTKGTSGAKREYYKKVKKGGFRKASVIKNIKSFIKREEVRRLKIEAASRIQAKFGIQQAREGINALRIRGRAILRDYGAGSVDGFPTTIFRTNCIDITKNFDLPSYAAKKWEELSKRIRFKGSNISIRYQVIMNDPVSGETLEFWTPIDIIDSISQAYGKANYRIQQELFRTGFFEFDTDLSNIRLRRRFDNKKLMVCVVIEYEVIAKEKRKRR